ncbi:MAG: hypothetical protein IKM87_07050 [Clostridia bacterium]|nr:hypothetical protein [Clostridia bacterium]
MKRMIAVFLMLALLSSSSCMMRKEESSIPEESSSPVESSEVQESSEAQESSEEPIEPLLDGLYEEGSPSDDIHVHSAFVEGDVIEVYALDYEEDTVKLFWSGSTGGLEKTDGGYRFISHADPNRNSETGTASSEKSFIFADGRITFMSDAFHEGKEEEITLKLASEADGLMQRMIDIFSLAHMEKLPLKRVSLEYTVRRENGDLYFFYIAEVYNPNMMIAVTMPKFSITAKDDKGEDVVIISSVMCDVAPEDTARITGACTVRTGDLKDVELVLKGAEESTYALQNDSGVPYSEDLVISGIKKTGEYSYEAELTNLSSVDPGLLKATIVFRKGEKMVLLDTALVDAPAPGETETIRLNSAFNDFEYDNVEIFVTPV